MTQYELGLALGMSGSSQSVITKIEHGTYSKNGPSRQMFERIANALGVSVRDLLPAEPPTTTGEAR